MSRQTEITVTIGTTELKFSEGNGALLDSFADMRLRYSAASHHRDHIHRIILVGLDARAAVIDHADVFLRAIGVHALSFVCHLMSEEFETHADEGNQFNARIDICIYA